MTMYPNANKELAREWVAALRSGKYPQGQQQLRNQGWYCCLGVLCDIVAPELWGLESLQDEGDQGFGIDNFGRDVNISLPPKWVVSMVTGDATTDDAFPVADFDWEEDEVDNDNLASWNDHGKSFDEIADEIERVTGLTAG